MSTTRLRSWRSGPLFVTVLFLLSSFSSPLAADDQRVLDDQHHHLRSGDEREWAEFPETAEAEFLQLEFDVADSKREHALVIRQRDVKQVWRVVVNDQMLGQLVQDENDLTHVLTLKTDVLKAGTNRLRIEAASSARPAADDIELGPITLISKPVSEYLSASELEVEVRDNESNQPLPGRLTILTSDGSLAPLQVVEDQTTAVRTGVVYTASGRVRIELPAGTYKLYAGRGFEYGLASTEVTTKGESATKSVLQIAREVPTDGYVSSDPHIHTLTYSGHGDATIAERMVTLVGEHIELPIATDHNIHVDFEGPARQLGVREFFTPIIGNEVTTRVGHFNVFPLRLDTKPPNHELDNWEDLFNNIYTTPDVRVAILNHPRDLHSGVRPFDPSRFNAVVGENLDGWPMRFNAMEIINSSATQNDVLRMPLDWMALLNRGYHVTPIGSSDSHDVARHFVGQGRTYIRADDANPGRIDAPAAIKSLVAGHVVVSYGLYVDMEVNDQYGPGDLVPEPESIDVSLRVLAPDWSRADHIALYVNGQLVREQAIDARLSNGGVQWNDTWRVDLPAHDVHLVAIATGPGIDAPYWRTAKPYQPKSINWTPRVMSCTGAVWIDADGDGQKTSAHEYAVRLVESSGGRLSELVRELAKSDAAVAAQAAHLMISQNGPPSADAEREWLSGSSSTAEGYRAYLAAWRECELARAGR